ncbi:MAG: rod shape-determining protein MreD [Frankia sp.]
MTGLRASTLLTSGAALVVAIIVQLVVIGPLHLPFGRPDLVLVLLACIALVEGPATGAVLGFGAGLLGDLLSLHVLGQLALVFCLVGYLVGMLGPEVDGSVAASLVVIAAAAAVTTLGYAATSAILGDPALSPHSVLPRAAGSAGYALLVAPFLFPAVAAALRRVEGGRAVR